MVKWTVYSLLLLNWALYIREDWLNAQHTLRNGGGLLDWTDAFGARPEERRVGKVRQRSDLYR